MPITVDIDVMMARRKMSVGELAERVGITPANLDWTFFAPAALIAPGERTGTFRTGVGKLIVDAQGNSKISAEDYAIAFVDALEQDSFVREIATVAY